MTKQITDEQVVQDDLLPCPFCGEALFVREGVNAYGRCDTEGCWMHERAYMVPLEDRRQVAAWNARIAHTPPAAEDVERELENDFRRAFVKREPVPPPSVMRLLMRAGCPNGDWRALWSEGKRLQSEHPGLVPWKTEAEIATGLWSRLLKALDGDATLQPAPSQGLVEASKGLVAGCHVGNLIDNLREMAAGCEHSNEASLAELCSCAANVIAALQSKATNERDAALEEAAKVADAIGADCRWNAEISSRQDRLRRLAEADCAKVIATAIRALKGDAR